MPQKVTGHRKNEAGEWVSFETEIPTPREEYEGRYRYAIVNALNVLGTPVDCPSCKCEGCNYERTEAISYLYGALGLEIDYKDPSKSYNEYCEIREKEWKQEAEDEGVFE